MLGGLGAHLAASPSAHAGLVAAFTRSAEALAVYRTSPLNSERERDHAAREILGACACLVVLYESHAARLGFRAAVAPERLADAHRALAEATGIPLVEPATMTLRLRALLAENAEGSDRGTLSCSPSEGAWGSGAAPEFRI